MFALTFLGLFMLNMQVFQSITLGSILLISYLCFFGYELGAVVHEESGVLRWWMGVWLLISSLSIVLTICFYVGKITPTVIQAVVLLSVPVILWISEHKGHPHWYERVHNLWNEKKHSISQPIWFASSLILLLLSYIFYTYSSSPILDAVRSAWDRIDLSVLIAFTLSTLILFALLYRGKERALIIPLFSLSLFAVISLAAFVFPIGYGFDSFIHKATESHIAEFGTITPKPFYYIGQYSLVLFANLGFHLPVDLVDTFLLPVLTALLLPFAWFGAAAHLTKNRRTATTALIGIILLPLSLFIVTTPQGLANLWTLLLILGSVPYLLKLEHPRLAYLSVGALTTVLIHPVAGIPVLFYIALLFCDPHRAPYRYQTLATWIYRLLAFGACIVIPLSFIVNAFVSKQALHVDWNALNPANLLSNINLSVFFENRFNPLLDFVYLYGLNTAIILFFFAIVGWMSEREKAKHLSPMIVMALALGINFLLMKTSINFSFLIDYERQNYTDRLIPLILFFLTPLFIIGISTCFTAVRNRALSLRIALLVLFAAFAVSSFYFTYPRQDAYTTSHGFNVSEADIQAVQLVEQLANGTPYLVLANQSVSAAAIEQIGFRYYDNLFFYPIPTGEKLYQKFLEMNDHPSVETAKQALDLVPMHGDVKTLFYIVDNYWWQAPRIIETTKTIATDWRSLGDGAVWVFRFDF